MTNSYARLTETELRDLLLDKESPTLEFKSEWYKIDKSYPQDTREFETGELIKDVLSLANRNADFAGDTAYLIIGVADLPGPDGNPQLRHVANHLPSQKELQQKFKDVCNPPLGHLYLDAYQIDGYQLYVIVIPPSPHLYETSGVLKTVRGTFPKYTVFVRHGEHVDIASTRERITLLEVKRGRFRNSRNAPAWVVGATSGAFIGGLLLSNMGDSVAVNSTLSRQQKKQIGALTGAGAGGLMGWMISQVINYTKEISLDWQRMPWPIRVLAATPFVVGMVVWRNLDLRKRKPQ